MSSSEFKCPECKRTILNRRLPDCEFCEATVPEEWLFTDAERQAIAEERSAKAYERRKKDAEKRAEERKKSARRGQVGLGFFHYPM